MGAEWHYGFVFVWERGSIPLFLEFDISFSSFMESIWKKKYMARLLASFLSFREKVVLLSKKLTDKLGCGNITSFIYFLEFLTITFVQQIKSKKFSLHGSLLIWIFHKGSFNHPSFFFFLISKNNHRSNFLTQGHSVNFCWQSSPKPSEWSLTWQFHIYDFRNPAFFNLQHNCNKNQWIATCNNHT